MHIREVIRLSHIAISLIAGHEETLTEDEKKAVNWVKTCLANQYTITEPKLAEVQVIAARLAPYPIRLSALDAKWYATSASRRRDLQNATQHAATEEWREAQLLAPDGTILFTAQPIKGDF